MAEKGLVLLDVDLPGSPQTKGVYLYQLVKDKLVPKWFMLDQTVLMSDGSVCLQTGKI
jgi:hypothetical protein